MDMTPKERHLPKLISKQVKFSYGTNSRFKLTPFMVHVFFLARHALRVRVIRTKHTSMLPHNTSQRL